MKNLTLLLTGFLLSLALFGCSSNKPKPVEEAVADCVFPNSTTQAPGWVCDAPVGGIAISAVGSTPKSEAGHDFMKKIAMSRARVLLAQQMKVHVSNLIKDYIGTTGVKSSETVDMVASSVTRQLTDQSLSGSKLYKSRVAPDGTLFVLMGLDKTAAQSAVKDSLKTSMSNDHALWQQFLAQKNHDELAAAIVNAK